MAGGVIRDAGGEIAAVASGLTTAVTSFFAWKSSKYRDMRQEIDELRHEADTAYEEKKELMDENMELKQQLMDGEA